MLGFDERNTITRQTNKLPCCIYVDCLYCSPVKFTVNPDVFLWFYWSFSVLHFAVGLMLGYMLKLKLNRLGVKTMFQFKILLNRINNPVKTIGTLI